MKTATKPQTQKVLSGDFGLYSDDYIFRNTLKALEAGLPTCDDCGRGVDVANSWSIRTNGTDIALASLTDDEAREALGGDFVWKLLGSTCGPKLCHAAYRTKTAELGREVTHQQFHVGYFANGIRMREERRGYLDNTDRRFMKALAARGL
jgi:hypothetical protein